MLLYGLELKFIIYAFGVVLFVDKHYNKITGCKRYGLCVKVNCKIGLKRGPLLSGQSDLV